VGRAARGVRLLLRQAGAPTCGFDLRGRRDPGEHASGGGLAPKSYRAQALYNLLFSKVADMRDLRELGVRDARFLWRALAEDAPLVRAENLSNYPRNADRPPGARTGRFAGGAICARRRCAAGPRTWLHRPYGCDRAFLYNRESEKNMITLRRFLPAMAAAPLLRGAAHKITVAGHPWVYAAKRPKNDIYEILDRSSRHARRGPRGHRN